MEENKSLSLDIWSVWNSKFTVQCRLSGYIIVGYQNADNNVVGRVLQAIYVDARVNQWVAPKKCKHTINKSS